MLLRQSFYGRSSIAVAQDLLGCFLMRRMDGRTVKCKIVETEAYEGWRDKASHASRGKTPANAAMFGPPGQIYVYFTYGLHHMLNIVTGKTGYPSAVLIRAIEPIDSAIKIFQNSKFKIQNFFSGPARLTKTLKIDKSFNGKTIIGKPGGLWIEKEPQAPRRRISRAARIGIPYAEEYREKKWRFYIKDSPFVSKP